MHLFRLYSSRRLLHLGLIVVLSLVGISLTMHDAGTAYAAPVDCADTITTGIPQTECDTLMVFYNSTNGAGWANSTNWGTATSVGTWHGVVVDGGHVMSIILDINQLQGPLPNLSPLSGLQFLALNGNQVSGSIPALPASLLDLSLRENQLTGSLPTSLPTSLQALNLNSNGLSGSIPALPASLEGLDLRDNQLTGSIPAPLPTSLQYLYLSNNQIVSVIPPSITGTNISSRLSLCGGNRIWTLDSSVASFVQARDGGWTQYCGFGTAPTAAADPSYSTTVTITLNQAAPGLLGNDMLGTPAGMLTFFGGGSLGGAVTDQAAGSSVALAGGTLTVNDNGRFVLTTPTTLGTYTFQYRLDNGVGFSDALVTVNVLSTAPTAAADPGYSTPANTTLNQAAPGLLGNDLRGTPTGMLTFFGGGSLGGAVTDQAAGSSVVLAGGTLTVNGDGSFVLTTPTTRGTYTFQYRLDNGVGSSDALVTIDVRAPAFSCADTGTTGIPQAECDTLMAFYNSTNGPGWLDRTNWGTATSVSTWFGVAVTDSHVAWIIINWNGLNGTLPDLSPLSSLQTLSLNNNQLNGSIPALPASMFSLNLSDNQLSGSIPALSTSVQYLDLSDNQLNGSIPALPASLRELYLNNNQIVSVIPPSITGTTLGMLGLCGGSNLIWTPDSSVASFVQARDGGWTQGCGLGTAPTAAADPGYSTPTGTALIQAVPGLLGNDLLGTPAGALISFGDGSLGGAVTDQAAGTSVALAGGTLTVNGNGSFSLTTPTTVGTYTFLYRLDNAVGSSDALVTIDVQNTGTPGVTITESGGSSIVAEGGATDGYTIVLTTAPSAGTVTIAATPDAQCDLGAGTGAAVTYTFDALTWNNAQTVTISAVNDTTTEGPHTCSITHAITASGAAEYSTSMGIISVTVQIIDNDIAGITVAPTSLSLTEGGAAGTYTIGLNTPPSGPLSLDLNFDPAQLTVNGSSTSPITLLFTTAAPQTVTVAAVNNTLVDGLRSSPITHTISASATAEYPTSMSISSVTVQIVDDESPTPEAVIPPPPPAPQCNNMDFDNGAAIRAWIPDSYRAAVYCHVIMLDGNYLWWYGSPLTHSGQIGNRTLIDLNVLQAVDVFAPSGPTWFEGGAVVCLRGGGSLWFLVASQAPRQVQGMTEYTVAEFPGYTCTTLWEPGTLILTQLDLTP